MGLSSEVLVINTFMIDIPSAIFDYQIQSSFCKAADPTCPSDQFTCDNGDCIDSTLVCNQAADCDDNSDEDGCGINECATIQANQCGQICVDTQTSYYCDCKPG